MVRPCEKRATFAVALVLSALAPARADEPPEQKAGVLFSEAFDDARLDRTDVVLRSTDFPNMKFNQYLLTPYFGPGLLPHEQTLWIDELSVGTKRLGPLPLPAPAAVR